MAKPSVSVLIAAFNQAALLKRALKSVMKQTYKNVKAIVYDDGSTDHTEDMMRKWEGERVRYVRCGQNRGYTVATNELFALADTDFATFLDHDDICNIHRVELQVELMTLATIDPSYVGTGVQTVSSATEDWWQKKPWLTWRSLSGPYTIMFRPQDALPFNQTFYPANDRFWEFEMALKHGVGYRLPMTLYHKDCRNPGRRLSRTPEESILEVERKRLSGLCLERGLSCREWHDHPGYVFPEMEFAPDGYMLPLIQRFYGLDMIPRN